MSEFLAVVLAAGQGTRMKSSLPKVLHPLAGLPLVSHTLKAAVAAGAEKAALVTPPGTNAFDAVAQKAGLDCRLFEQTERLGTAHAVLMARPFLEGADKPVLVLYGDTPLIPAHRLAKLSQSIAHGADVVVMGFHAHTPKGYGRLVTDAEGRLIAIREEKDATDAERAIALCNSGIMAFRGDLVLSLLDRIGNANKAGEYYLTDAVELAHAQGLRVAFEVAEEDEVRGVNTRAQLSEAEAIFQGQARLRAMDGGTTLIAPETVTFAHDTVLGQDVLIEPNVFFGPGVTIEDGVTVKAFSHLEGAHLEKGVIIGPFARLRPGTHLGESARIGNFVEIKQTRVEAHAKVNHLSYIGDADVGRDANIGAGVITCNYDGFRKHKTEIGAGAFIGSNSALVAPVKIGGGAYVGSGSVITNNVPDDALALNRAPQVSREGWAARYRARHEAGAKIAANGGDASQTPPLPFDQKTGSKQV